MKPEHIYRLPVLSDPRISPDENHVAFVVTQAHAETNSYRSAIWLVPSDGSAPPRRLTAGERDVHPRWSPDGSTLAFLSKRDDRTQVYALPMAGGEPWRITSRDEGVSSFVWSPSGESIAIVSTEKGSWFDESDESRRPPRHIKHLRFKADGAGFTVQRWSHIFVAPADGEGEPRRLTKGEFNHADPAWSPDGRRIVFCAYREPDWDTSPVTDLHIVDVQSGRIRRVTRGDGRYARPSWSPDGRSIACRLVADLQTAPRHAQIAVVDVRSRSTTVLTEALDRQCSPSFEPREPIWSNGELVFPVETQGFTYLYSVPAEGIDPKPLISGEFSVSDHDAVGSTIVHAATTPTRPAELFNGEIQLTKLTAAFRKAAKLVAPQRFTATSPDGSEVDAWIMPPAAHRRGQRYPTLLFIHGGPFTQYQDSFFDEFQIAAKAGYAVLYANPRGSSGYSEGWGRAIRGPISGGPGMGSVDYQDLIAVVDTALERFDFCDPDRLGVLGGSYGGYMTLWMISHTDRFKAACAERGLYNIVSCVGTGDSLWSASTWWGGRPYDDIDAIWQMSPLAHVDAITTPLLLIHSDQDLRCPVEQAEQVFVALRLAGREVEFVRFPHGTHDLSRAGPPLQRVYRFEAIIEWFDRHLKPKVRSGRRGARQGIARPRR